MDRLERSTPLPGVHPVGQRWHDSSRSSRARACPRPARRPAGRAPCATPASTSRISRPVPATNRADLLERSLRRRQPDPLERCASTSCSSRSRDSARCAPRFVPATACTSSRITVSIPRSVSRACDVRRRKSDSGVVMRMSGGVRSTPSAFSAGRRLCEPRLGASTRARRAGCAGSARCRSSGP